MSTSHDAALLKPGFTDAVFEAQAGFRALLDALAYAGRITTLEVSLDPPAPLDPATAAIALTLFDFDTKVWLDAPAAAGPVPAWIRFHCGSPIVSETHDAQFALVADARHLPGLGDFDIGEDRHPDRSSTLVIQVPALTGGSATRWTGPGINGSIEVAIAALPEGFWAQWDDNHALYPQGVDVLFVCGRQVIGLPRGVKVEV
ncbi:phosphonate C-P lyase system protein PhnH [Devosia nitrariae]|uniref:Carbon-phosphorus lyase subunit PhnH n=1 Tax=Devosia nitrariae TaxID=2071872 RepID=A0ABQ5W6I9_9HYPH|nr:phosphonate C-P lyase system protein PhnH [Devosia nitrariae]GLQ55261.1 carbon-phosphorus lyase subunit PhnH [Devosia nitrariae]